MITLHQIDINNFHAISALKLPEEQEKLVGSADWILALTYAQRSSNANALAIMLDDIPIGVVATNEVSPKNEPGFYYIGQIFVDTAYQQRGYGRQAMKLIIELLKKAGRFDRVRLDVHKSATVAVNLYKSLGFTLSGYVDSANPELLFFELIF